jgi:formate dehydrogenase maturation protein FdhE
MPFADCKPSKWYVVITCDSCGIRQPLYPDPSDGKSELESAIVRCPLCKCNHFYKATAFERYRHTKAASDDISDILA